MILVDPRKTWKTTRNLADYEGPLRRRRICRAVWPSLLSRTDIFGKIQPTWKDLSLSRRLGFVGGVRLQRMKKRRDRAFCARTTRVLGPMPRNRVLRTTVSDASCPPLLPNSRSFLSLGTDSLSARADKLDPERFSRRGYFKTSTNSKESFNLRGWVCRHVGRVRAKFIFFVVSFCN